MTVVIDLIALRGRGELPANGVGEPH
jgi:hypothetical protein